MTPEEVVRAIVDAYASGDLDRVLANVTEDVRYRVEADPRYAVFAFDATNRDEFEAAMVFMGNRILIRRFDIEELFLSGPRAVSRQAIELEVRATGEIVALQNTLFWTVRGDRISDVLEFVDTGLVAASVSKGM